MGRRNETEHQWPNDHFMRLMMLLSKIQWEEDLKTTKYVTLMLIESSMNDAYHR
jgi:hypothetical protein